MAMMLDRAVYVTVSAMVAFGLSFSSIAGDQPNLNATDGSNPLIQFGDGATSSCGEFVSASFGLAPGTSLHMTQDGRLFQDRSAIFLQWSLGFLTAVNVVRALEPPPRPRQIEVDAAAVVVWLTKHCTDNPTDTIAMATTQLAIELAKQ